MALNINGTTGISGVDGSASAPAVTGTDSNTGINFGSDTVNINTGGSARVTVDSAGAVGIGTTTPTNSFANADDLVVGDGSGHRGMTILAGTSSISGIEFSDGTGSDAAKTAGGIRYDHSGSYMRFNTNDGSERLRINSSGDVNINNTGNLDAYRLAGAGSSLRGHLLMGDGRQANTTNDSQLLTLNRLDSDGTLITFSQNGNQEGNISVSGSSVSYNGGVLTRWSQLKGISSTDKSVRPTIYQGTVMSNLDDLCEWEGEENQQLNMTKVSDVDGDKDVAGVFWAWDDDDNEIVNDFYIAMTGDMVIRVAASTTVARGDLLISAGDGTAKPQDDDIVRSSTIAKIISTNHTATYADGSKAYPCVLMAC
jgi:hypothetical protein